MIVIACPHCGEKKRVRKHGATETGTPRARCMNCNRTFALAPRSRAVTSEKEDAIVRHLNERIAVRAICRLLRVSPNTVYRVIKNNPGVRSRDG